jgi:hypothetical protein
MNDGGRKLRDSIYILEVVHYVIQNMLEVHFKQDMLTHQTLIKRVPLTDPEVYFSVQRLIISLQLKKVIAPLLAIILSAYWSQPFGASTSVDSCIKSS